VGKRHEAIGIKQAIRYEWMQKVANLVLVGLDKNQIRKELHDYLEDRMGSGTRGERSAEARSFAVSILMNTWATPDPVLMRLRNSLLKFVEQGGGHEKVAHWIMICAAYPFWFNVARQTGRLLALQDQVTMKQITNRMVEEYGDRQTVSRNAQFVVRSFVYWGFLVDATIPGSYEKAAPGVIQDQNLAILMFEGALHATTEAKGALGLLSNSPAFFPFQLPVMTGALVVQRSDRIDVVRYGLDDELLKLKGN